MTTHSYLDEQRRRLRSDQRISGYSLFLAHFEQIIARARPLR
jgi:hypothetical protein